MEILSIPLSPGCKKPIKFCMMDQLGNTGQLRCFFPEPGTTDKPGPAVKENAARILSLFIP